MKLARIGFLAFGILLGWLAAALSQNADQSGPPPLGRDAMYEATQEALAHLDRTERAVLTVKLLDQVTDENVEAMFQALEDTIRFTPERETRLIVREMARRDPQGTFERVLQWPPNQSARGVQVVILEWAKVNPIAAREAAVKVVEGDKAMTGALKGLVSGWAMARKPGLSEFIMTVPDPKGVLKLEFAVAQASEIYRQEGGQAVLDWALEQRKSGDPEWGRIAFNQTLNALAQRDPELGARFLDQHGSEPWAVEGPRWLSGTWANLDPTAAIAWLETLPAGQSRSQFQAMYHTWKTWHRNSPEEASAWLEASKDGPSRDGAVAAYVDWMKRTDPRTAISAAADIQNPEFRQAAQAASLQFWLGINRPDAEAWLAETNEPLPESLVAQAREKSRRGRSIPQMLADQEEELLRP